MSTNKTVKPASKFNREQLLQFAFVIAMAAFNQKQSVESVLQRTDVGFDEMTVLAMKATAESCASPSNDYIGKRLFPALKRDDFYLELESPGEVGRYVRAILDDNPHLPCEMPTLEVLEDWVTRERAAWSPNDKERSILDAIKVQFGKLDPTVQKRAHRLVATELWPKVATEVVTNDGDEVGNAN